MGEETRRAAAPELPERWLEKGRDPKNEERVKSELGPKMEEAGKSVSDPKFFENVKLLFEYLISGESLAPKAVIVGALLYFIAPFDLVPDAIPVVGYVEDIALVAGVTAALADLLRRFKKKKEQEVPLPATDPNQHAAFR